jgi:hypothetical protein
VPSAKAFFMFAIFAAGASSIVLCADLVEEGQYPFRKSWFVTRMAGRGPAGARCRNQAQIPSFKFEITHEITP